MAIIITLDVMLARRKMKSKELAAIIGITEANLSKLKSGNIKGVKLDTMNKICEALDCKPGDLIDFYPEGEENLSQDI
ncbi:MAG: helix-turn-helix transcriptional regulator [Robiginitomaculum sp.]|nr:helix-turn-helix transcriptional regulator [Robiginitomaculum sp.]